MPGHHIALLDVDDLCSYALTRGAAARGEQVWALPGGARLADLDGAPEPDLLVLGADGNDLEIRERVRAARSRLPATPVVILARNLETETVVALVRSQADDVIGLPLPPEQVAERVLGLLVPAADRDVALRGDSAAMRALRRSVQALRETRSTVLITGEPGTAKGRVARWIARATDPPDTPFVRLDCSASRWPGSEGGALPADIPLTEDGRIRPGLLGGTLFLDEVAELSPELQTVLATVLKKRIPLDAPTPRVRLRFIAATHADLASEVQAERFRTDLYFELNVLRIRVPPLRERLADLPVLVEGLLERHAERLGRAAPPVEASFLEALARHAWPGNLRELDAVVERALAAGRPLDGPLAEDVLDRPGSGGRSLVATLPPLPSAGELGLSEEEERERARMAEVLVATAGNVARAARRLEIPRSTLRYRIRRYALGSLIPRD